MAAINSTTLSTVVKAVIDLQVDAVELEEGALVKVGQIGSVGGKPVFMYLSTNESAT